MKLEGKIQLLLRSHPTIRLALLFGSLGRGQANLNSDLDLAVAGSNLLEADEKIHLIAELAELSGRPVDLIDLQSTGATIFREALSKGKLIYCTDREFYAELIKRMIFDQADFSPYRQRILEERRVAWLDS